MRPTDNLAPLATALMAAGMFLGGMASAQASCPTGQSVGDFMSSPCGGQDTLFQTSTSTSTQAGGVSGAQPVSYPSGNGATAPGDYKLAYSVSMVDDPGTTTLDGATQQSFEDVALDVSAASVEAGDGRLIVSTQVFSDGFDDSAPLTTVASVDGGPGGSYGCGPACGSTLYVLDNVKVENRGVGLNALTNPFTQIQGPISISAPGTFGIFGLGLVGLGIARARRRKCAAPVAVVDRPDLRRDI